VDQEHHPQTTTQAALPHPEVDRPRGLQGAGLGVVPSPGGGLAHGLAHRSELGQHRGVLGPERAEVLADRGERGLDGVQLGPELIEVGADVEGRLIDRDNAAREGAESMENAARCPHVDSPFIGHQHSAEDPH